MRPRPLAVISTLFGLVLLAGCGDVTVQSRFIPTPEEIAWGDDLHELPWQPPALDYHKPRPKLDPEDQSFIMYGYPDALFDMRFEFQGHE